MDFLTTKFLILLFVTAVVNYIAPKAYRAAGLLTASLVFYYLGAREFFMLLLALCLATYLLGLLVECYVTPFLHGLLPMANAMRWIRTVVFFLTLAGSAAWFGYYQRQSAFRVQPAVILAAGLLFWNLEMQETAWDGILIVGDLILLGFLVFPWKGEHPDED